jgi:UDP-sulfoquinovose synthase
LKILILGGDGYLGWPTAMQLAEHDHEVYIVDNYSRKMLSKKTLSEALFETKTMDEKCEIFKLHTGKRIRCKEIDCSNYIELSKIVKSFQPDAVIHYAEQPSAPYSMLGYGEAKFTLDNNVGTTLSILWAIKEFAPNCHIVKLGTMGEYGTPEIDIEEGWLEVSHKGRSDKFLYPRQASSLYHTSKILDTDLIWFYVRTYGLRVTDLMQGPVYGLITPETKLADELMPHFHYDDIFGTVVNRFLVQAIAGIPLTIYGRGEQKRGYLNLIDTLNCVELAVMNPPDIGELKIYNQLTEVFSVNEIAKRIQKVGNAMNLNVEIQQIANPRKEKEKHYYNPKYTGLTELGLKPTLMSDDVLSNLLHKIAHYRDGIQLEKILPRVSWST